LYQWRAFGARRYYADDRVRVLLTIGTALLMAAAPASAAVRWGELETIGGTGFNVRVGIDARGDALALWDDPSAPDAAYSWRKPRGEWTAPRTLATARQADLDISPLGHATLAWVAYGTHIVVATSRPGGSFRSREVIDLGDRTATGSVEVEVDDAGNVLVAWADFGPEGPDSGRIAVATRRAGGHFTEPQTVSSEPVSGLTPEVTQNAAGATFMTWETREFGPPKSSFSPPAGTFGPEEEVPVSAEGNRTPVALDQAGQVFASTSAFAPIAGVPSSGTTYAVRSPLGEWGEPISLDSGGLVQQVIAEPHGAVSFVVERSDGSQLGREVAFTTRLPSGELIGPDTISSPNSSCSRVAMDVRGNMLGTWCRDFDGQARGTTIGIAERHAGGRFGAEEVVSPPDSIGSDAALTDGGPAVVAWSHARTPGDLGSAELQAIVREDRSKPPLPFPPDVDVNAPADPALSDDGTLKVPVRCSRRCTVRATGLLLRDGRPVAVGQGGPKRKLRAKRRGFVRLRFGPETGSGEAVSVSVKARGRSPRPVTFSRRIRLR
jgi:hypothetical protein